MGTSRRSRPFAVAGTATSLAAIDGAAELHVERLQVTRAVGRVLYARPTASNA